MKSTPDDSMTLFHQKCAAHGLRITPQRTAIYQQLAGVKNHPTAETTYAQIKKSFPHISFDTVYRTLLTFAQIGLLRIVEGSGQPRRFDPGLEPHHHIRCLHCNTITDFHESSFDRITVPRKLTKDFTIINKTVLLDGIRRRCRPKNRKP